MPCGSKGFLVDSEAGLMGRPQQDVSGSAWTNTMSRAALGLTYLILKLGNQWHVVTKSQARATLCL